MALAEGYHGHEFSPENQEAALDFLDHFNQMSSRHGLPEVKELSANALQCTSTGQVMVDYTDAKSLMAVIREFYEEHKTAPRQAIATQYYAAKYSGIKAWHVREYSGISPAQGEMSWEMVGSSQSSGTSIDRYVLRHSKVLEMPLLHIHRAGVSNGGMLLWFGENGKATANDWPEIKKYVAASYDVISFDFRGLGETRMAYTAVSPDDPELNKLDFDHAYVNPISGVLANHVYNSLLIGRPYFLQMIEDAEIASLFAKQRLGARTVTVRGKGDAYGVAAAISETLSGVKLLPGPDAKLLKWSEIVEQKRETWPIEYLLPSGAYIH
jgi:hypothetical protein